MSVWTRGLVGGSYTTHKEYRNADVNHSRFVLCEVDAGEQVVENGLDERESVSFKLLCALENFTHVLDVLGIVAVQLRQRLLVALSCRLLVLPTSLHLLLQLLHLRSQENANITRHL